MDGREEAVFGQWIRKHGPWLLDVARSFAEDADEAEDILQETWIVALRNLDQRPRDPSVRAWLYSIALRIGGGRLRTRTRRSRLLGQWPLDVPMPCPATMPSSERGARMIGQLWREIGALPPLEQQVILLRLVGGMTMAETAASLNRAEGTVKASQHRALRKLRAHLRPPGEPGPDLQLQARDSTTNEPRKDAR